jgi:hypothetical protein
MAHRSRLRRLLPAALIALAAAWAALAQPARAAGSGAAAHAHKHAPQSRPPILPYVWPQRFVDEPGLGGVPVYAGIDEFLRRVRAEERTERGHGLLADANERVRFEAPASAQRLASFAEQRPDLQDGATGESCVVRFINYRLPWLMTPETAVHALPTLSMGGAAVRFDVMAGAIGGRSAAFGQFVVRF